ncbi:hypothetical protein HMPREF1624_01041 [Sporothrix schenckii ATCC 58251]|uniref:ABC transporter n=2 Tax=Sporothrix schenckii TaxID=29908 RepID=U7Q4C0_SPOS1|nr:hypothetical protein HMPREF1624_01041 [Sporothrix schenckii ATCC 58251]
MDPSLCGFAADTLFGPAVASCRREFDFTVLFEEAVLTIIPAGTFALLASAIVVIAYRHKSPALVRSGRLYPLKLCSIAALTAAQVAVLVFQARAPNKTTTSIPSAVVSLVVTSIFLPLVSHIEHFTSRRPSALLSIFLVLTSLFDSTRTRTSWLVARASGSTNGAEIGLAIALTVTVAIRVVLLYLETKGKKELLILLRENEQVPAEILAGPISRTVFHWLNSLLLVGYRNALQATDFGPIDDRLLSVRLRPKFQRVRDQYVNKENKSAASVSTNRLIVLTFSSLGNLLAGPIIARLAVTAFSFTQPFLAKAALTYLQSETDPNQPASRNYGYGLIGATALTYVGIAAATSWYWHQAYRCSIMIRGGLTGVVFDKLMKLPEGDDIESKATTLVVNDVERIMRACARGHEVWAGTIETGLATWLLYRQLGPSCLVMLGVAAIAGLASTQSVKQMGARQQQWLAATQNRLKSTKHMLDSLKGIKMTSQDDVAYDMLNKLRAAEIKDSAPFRWIIIISCFLSYCTMILSPPLILGVYVGVGTSGGGHQDFSISTIFTSLVIIALLSSPLVQLFQVLPSLGAAHGCFGRLNTFLQLKEKTDFRDFRNGHNGPFAEKTAISSADAPIVSLQDVSLAWNESDTPVLTNINLEVQKGSKTAIVGPVGSGKTLLLKGIIGEVYKTHGVLSLSPTTSLAYCSQKPWLENMSAKRNLTQYGSETFNSDFYREIASNCMLDDIIQLPTFTSGAIGTGGVMLSGGQRQRLALARALSTKSSLLIIDDGFSALDRKTRRHVSEMLLSHANSDRTIIYSTHDENIARLADEAYRIDESGHLSKISLDIVADEGHGSEDEPSASLDIVETGQPELASNATNAAPKPRFSENEEDTSEEEEPPRVAMAHKLLGDLAVFKVYFKSVGWVHSTVFLFGAISWAISFKFSDVWIQWWTDAVDSGDSSKPLGYWLGVYAGLGVLALFVLTAWLYHQQFNIVSRSGENLHGQLATTVFKAQFPVISQIDTGTTLNRFSQDLMLVDMQLPLDLFNTASEFFTALIQVALIASASSWPALGVVPAMLILLYAVQHFYLRTSKQLRLHELEAKAALVTKISETGAGDGLSTIRAHGPVWVDKTRNRFDDKMDRSQEPLYLLYAVQRWLQLVLNLSVAGLVVVVLGTSVALKSSSKSRISPGAVGVAFLNAVTFGETITQFVTAWTGLETSLGAIARISLFQRQTAIEEDVAAGGSQQPPAIQDPGVGTIRFENVWATYDDIITDDVDPVTAQDENGRPRQGQHWSLRGVTLDIRAGERVAICGKTGSGKSTMHLALLRMVNIPVGSVFINGFRHTNMSLEKLRKSFYIISQDTPHLGFDTLRQWIDPHAAFSDEHIVQVLRECGVLDMVMNTPGGLTASKGNFKFSVGEEQLLSVARVILDVERREGAQGGNRGGIVLLDEATSSVDKDTEEKMENLIKTRLVGKTLIAINHRLEAVMDYDRALVLDNGMVVDFGTPAELVQRCELFAGLKARSG